MSSPPSNEPRAGDRRRAEAPVAAGALCALAVVLPAWLSGCSSTPSRKPVAHAGVVPSPGPAAIPDQVQESFDHAVELMRQGETEQAEEAFTQVEQADPKLATPDVNIGILYRKQGQLAEAEKFLQTAVEHNAKSAIAWTELGATQSMRGEFHDAEASYEKAIEVNPSYAPAYRNLGVVEDLYLGDPVRALAAFKRYKALTGEDEPVSNWIAELSRRVRKLQTSPSGSATPGPSQKEPETAAAAPKVVD